MSHFCFMNSMLNFENSSTRKELIHVMQCRVFFVFFLMNVEELYIFFSLYRNIFNWLNYLTMERVCKVSRKTRKVSESVCVHLRMLSERRVTLVVKLESHARTHTTGEVMFSSNCSVVQSCGKQYLSIVILEFGRCA